MEAFVSCLLENGRFDRQQLDLIKSRLVHQTISKGGYFSEAGKVARQVGFNTSGIFRVCRYSEEGEEFTRAFIDENRFIVDYNSFNNEIPCGAYIQALTDCELLVIGRADFVELSDAVPDWEPTISRIVLSNMMRKVSEAGALLSSDGRQRYETFLERYPGIVNRIPLSALASYLGVTQSSLSRIRKNF
jgi:CRP-like cAMP-binding protein